MPELVVLAEQLLAEVPGGTGRYTRELTMALAATAPAGWTVATAVAKHADPTAAVLPGVRGPHVLPLPRRALIAAWERGVPLWPGGDSVHAPTPLAPSAAKRGRGLVVTVHDTVPWTHPETLTARGAAWHRRVIARAAQNAGALVVPTSAVSSELGQYVHPASRVHVIGHGVPASLSTPPDAEYAAAVADRLGLPPRYLLAIGTVEPRKGFDVLVEALGRPSAPELPLVVVGQQGWGEVDLVELAEHLGVDPGRLLLLGSLPDAELAVVLHRASVFVAPSLAEGFGMPLLEAMAVGVPVVHSDAPALVEVAGGTGLTVRRRDSIALAAALRRVLEDTDATAARVAAAKHRAEGFTWRRAAASVWRVHLDLHRARM